MIVYDLFVDELPQSQMNVLNHLLHQDGAVVTMRSENGIVYIQKSFGIYEVTRPDGHVWAKSEDPAEALERAQQVLDGEWEHPFHSMLSLFTEEPPKYNKTPWFKKKQSDQHTLMTALDVLARVQRAAYEGNEEAEKFLSGLEQ
jgi:hypothetical protein